MLSPSGRFRSLAALVLLCLALVAPASALDKKEYRVYFVVDIVKPKFQEVMDGFRESLDRQLAASGAKAVYTVFDTKTDPAAVPPILEAIKAGSPDLVCTINGPAAFADMAVAAKFPDPRFRIVSLNAFPVQSGVAKEWKRPGGNVTGVGILVQMSSLVKLARMVNPQFRKLIFFSWDRMTMVNDWFVGELKAACAQEGIELAEVKLLASAEDEFEFLLECDKKGPEYFGFEGISAWVHRDGSYADMAVDHAKFFKANMRHFATFSYEEAPIKADCPAGTSIVWFDLGAQLADKGMKILEGAKPGDLSWEYPRKYTIILNLAAAKLIGLSIPQSLIGAAARVYTDFDGNFLGGKN